MMINHGQIRYDTPDTIGSTCVEVLAFLKGQPWNQLAYNFLLSVNPSWVRVIPGPGHEVKTDARYRRVTIYLDDDNNIEKIEQEVEVGLEDSYKHGHDLMCALEAQKTVL